MGPADWAALGLFCILWFGYEPILRRVGKASGAIATDMNFMRAVWMRAMAGRKDTRLLDSQLMGHIITSASFFTSSNLILMAGVAGALFSGEAADKVSAVGVAVPSQALLQAKLALIVVVLARGMLNFIWAIRQMNYCLALIGAAPDRDADPVVLRAYADAAAEVLNPALSSFSQGIRGYYFALSAAAWLFGPGLFAIGTLAAFSLLVYRQARSRAAQGVRIARSLLEG